MWRNLTPEARFWANVVKTDECWNWTGYSVKGYGRLWVRGRTVRAHRYSYELHVGAVPHGLVVCHACDNPSCVRPTHLFVGTQFDNAQDASLKGRTARGARSGMVIHRPVRRTHRIDAEAALLIRGRLAAGERQVDIARDIRMPIWIVRNIRDGKAWAWVESNARRADQPAPQEGGMGGPGPDDTNNDNPSPDV